jgi:hypothetical protein
MPRTNRRALRRRYHDWILGSASDDPVGHAIAEYAEYRRLPIDDRLDEHFRELRRAPWYSRLWDWIQG